MTRISKPLKYILILLLILILIVGGYLAYVLTSYYRIEDYQELTPELSGSTELESKSVSTPAVDVPIDKQLSLTAWNIGFGAYTDQYSFFMDGGKYSRGFSEEAVCENVEAMAGLLEDFSSDFYLIQEVDIDSTRSYHIDQKQILSDALPGRSSTFAMNYDSPYLFYPFTEPHGKSVAGLLTLSDYEIKSAVRRSLPIQDDLAKLVDLDRCYSVNRLNTEDGREMVLYNFHLSAYTTDPTIANQQLAMLYEDMVSEYASGNYVICGGDFNKDLLGNSGAVFGVSGEDFSWAQPLPAEDIPQGFSLVAPFDEANPVPSCRNADSPWNPDTNFQITIDGFLVSDNVEVVEAGVVDLQFAYSDHNPVQMTFILN
jgi:endonuclease/exonuclease/phosphatase family metal-dependent hydrolase